MASGGGRASDPGELGRFNQEAQCYLGLGCSEVKRCLESVSFDNADPPLADITMWRSLASHQFRELGIVGSNPTIVTDVIYCGGARVGTGRRLLTATTQVQFLPPQLLLR